MNQAAVQNNMFSVREEMQSAAAAANRREQVVCPKPRRVGITKTTVNNDPFRERFDSLAANDDLDLLCFKGGCGLDNFSSFSTQLASPPPFLYGSPPCRVANPLIQDARFGDEKLVLFSPVAAAPPSSAGRKGCVRSNIGDNPVVRIEGFDLCLDMERQNRDIAALA